MSDNLPRKLAPMTALEFAIENAFRHFFFSLRLVLGWLLVLSPLLVLAWYVMFSNGTMPDLKNPKPEELGVLAALGAAVFLASVSVAVNWHRRVLLNESPRRLGWIGLGGRVWKYLFGIVVIAIVLAIYGAAVFAALTYLEPALAPKVAAAAKPAAIAVSVLIGLSALFSFYRLCTWLPAISTGESYGLGAAWRRTRKNRFRFISFTFWLLFSLAVVGALGAGAFFGQKALANPWATGAAYAFIGILVWLTLFILLSIPAGHYVHFGREQNKQAESGA